MTLRRAASLEVGQGVVSSYVHNAVIEGAGKIGVIVALESAGKTDELAVLGRQLAMHVAAAKPQALDPAGLDPELVKREKDVLADKYRQQGKPENVIEKIVDSGLKTFYKEVCLLDQAFIHDSGKSVAQAVKEAGIRFRSRGCCRQRQEITAENTFRRVRRRKLARGQGSDSHG
jgi:elongation factor Ts